MKEGKHKIGFSDEKGLPLVTVIEVPSFKAHNRVVKKQDACGVKCLLF
jgi:hypothetical protein